MDNITQILKRAADDAQAAFDYNLTKEASIRPSRAGLPLIQLVFEDILLPKLPEPPSMWKTKADPFASVMRLSTGHLFEKAVEQELLSIYQGSDSEVITQQQLTLDNMVGSCDMMVINHRLKTAMVIECKALKAYSVDEVKHQKLLCDNWGYLTQLAIYTLAVKQKYPDYEVIGWWYVWIKQLERHTKVAFDLTLEQLQQLHVDVLEKSQQYDEFKRDFSEGKLSFAVSKLLQRTEDLPQKIQAGGYMKGSCGLHFNSYSSLFTKYDGTLVDNAEDVVLLLTRAAYYGDGEQTATVLQLLNTKLNQGK